MQIDKSSILEIANIVATTVIDTLEKRGTLGTAGNKVEQHNEKSAYQKTEQLLYSYNAFKRIVEERMLEIDNLRKYGVPQKSTSIVEYAPHCGTVHGITLVEESVEDAVRNVQMSVEGTVQAIALIDKCMAALKNDPYYSILEMRYFEGRTQEDIASYLNCSQVTISKNKNRLVKELSMRLFPNQVIDEYLN